MNREDKKIISEVCTDNRFEIIERAKKALLDSTNIDTSPDEMKVLDNFLFRCWQMGWLAAYEDTGLTPEEIMEMKKGTGWIPCSEELPENAKHKGEYCPRYMVMADIYGVTEGWYNPDHESWYVIAWFICKPYNNDTLDMQRGDKPSVITIPIETGIVKAWMPLPELWEGEKERRENLNR